MYITDCTIITINELNTTNSFRLLLLSKENKIKIKNRIEESEMRLCESSTEERGEIKLLMRFHFAIRLCEANFCSPQ